MVEKIDRLESEYEGRITVLLESRRSKQDGLEAMRCSRADNSAESTHRLARRLSIVWEIVEPPLNPERRAKLANDSPLDTIELERRTIGSRYSKAHYCFFSSIVQMSLCLSPIVK